MRTVRRLLNTLPCTLRYGRQTCLKNSITVQFEFKVELYYGWMLLVSMCV